jgi:DNA-binding beta-propeller fold protein YncE
MPKFPLIIWHACLLWGLLTTCSSPAATADEPRPAPAKFVLEWGQHGSAPGEFDVPIGVVVTVSGDVLVSDFYNARVQRFTADGKHLSSIDVLPNPGGMALDGDGDIYLSHFSAMKTNEEKKPDRISVYTAQGTLLRQWGQTGTGDGEFDYPGGIAVSRDGRVYVADQTNRRVQVFDREGKFLFKWGEYGINEAQFGGNVSPKSRVGGPQFVAIDAAGHIYTTEGSVGRVQKFTGDGKFLRTWGDNQDKPGSFGGYWSGTTGLQGPVGICLDKRGSLWISAVSGRVQQFTPDGAYLQGLGNGRGSDPGEFEAPHSLATDDAGHLYVVDALNHRVQKFAIGK